MDPISAVGLVASAVQIAATSLSALQKLEHIRTKYQSAAVTLNSLYAESELVRTSLIQLDKLATDRNNTLAAAIRSNPDLSAALGRTLQGCNAVYSRLNEELAKIASVAQSSNSSKLDFSRRGRFILKEKVLEDYLSQIRGHQTALTLFLQMHSLNDISSLVAMLSLLLNTLREQMPAMQRTYSFDALSDAETLVSTSRRVDMSSLFDDIPENPTNAPGTLAPSEPGSKSPGNLWDSWSNQKSGSDHGYPSPILEPSSKGIAHGHSPTEISPAERGRDRNLVLLNHTNRNPFRRTASNRRSTVEAGPSIRDSIDTSKILVDESEADLGPQFSVRTFRALSSPELFPSMISDDLGPTALLPDFTGSDKIAVADDISDSMKIPVNPANFLMTAPSPGSPFSAGSFGDPRRDSDQTVGSRTSIATSLGSFTEAIGVASVFPRPGRAAHALPPTTEETREALEARRWEAMRSTDTAQQLRWADDALRFLCTDRKHSRLKRKPKVKADIDASNNDDADQGLEDDAQNIVEELSHQGSAKALFLKARRFRFEGDDRRKFYLKALSKGYLRAAYYVGKAHEADKCKHEAIGHYQHGKDGGDAASSHRLAEAMLAGELDQKKDHKYAIQLLRYAAAKADSDYPEPLYRLAELQTASHRKIFKIKKTVLPIDEVSARENYLKAAVLGHPKAQLTIGIAYARRDLGFPLDAALSLHYLRLASQQGSAEADYEISNWFWWGLPGVMDANPEMAFRYARRAAEDGFVPAHVQLGYFYETGFGTKVDKGKAKNCYLKGASLGDNTARTRLDALLSGMRI